MKLLVYAVYDRGIAAFAPPFYVRASGEALRSFQSSCADEQSNLRRYPADYSLFQLGLYDDSAGVFDCHEPERVISALECQPEVGREATVDVGDREVPFEITRGVGRPR